MVREGFWSVKLVYATKRHHDPWKGTQYRDMGQLTEFATLGHHTAHATKGIHGPKIW